MIVNGRGQSVGQTLSRLPRPVCWSARLSIRRMTFPEPLSLRQWNKFDESLSQRTPINCRNYNCSVSMGQKGKIFQKFEFYNFWSFWYFVSGREIILGLSWIGFGRDHQGNKINESFEKIIIFRKCDLGAHHQQRIRFIRQSRQVWSQMRNLEFLKVKVHT